jgi:hypothetical protein
MHVSRSLLILPLCAAAAGAQIIDTLPTGYANRHGDWSSGTGVSYPFSAVAFRYQEVHNTWTGRVVPPLRAIGFRRGPYRAANTTAVAHTLDAQVTMGFGSVGSFTTSFAGNYTGTPTVVFTNKPVSMPDRTTITNPPWAWTSWLVFDVPFINAGQADVVWELQTQNSTLPNPTSALYYTDRTSTTSAGAAVLAPGCIATGRTSPATLTATWRNMGTTAGMGVTLAGANWPASTPVVCHLGVANPNLTLPGLCAPVQASFEVQLPVGTSSATGSLTSLVLNFPHNPVLLQLPIYSQGVAPDPGQPGLPVVLSDGRIGSMPPGNASPNFVFRYTYVSGTGGTGSGPFTAGSVITAYR